MPGLRNLNLFDVARALGGHPAEADPVEVCNWLQTDYQNKPKGGFNYDPSIRLLPAMFEGTISPLAASEACLRGGNPTGRKPNADAIGAVGRFAAESRSLCYRLPYAAIVIGRHREDNIFMGVKIPLIRVEKTQAFLVLPNFRSTCIPNAAQIGFVISTILHTFARDYSPTPLVEYLAAAPIGPGKPRALRRLTSQDVTIWSVEAVERALQIYVEGAVLAANQGADMQKPDLRGYRIIDPRSPGLFAG